MMYTLLCMYMLQKAHIGEVQVSIWPKTQVEKLKEKTVLELFNDFYKYQNNIDMNKKEQNIINNIIDEIKEGDE